MLITHLNCWQDYTTHTQTHIKCVYQKTEKQGFNDDDGQQTHVIQNLLYIMYKKNSNDNKNIVEKGLGLLPTQITCLFRIQFQCITD